MDARADVLAKGTDMPGSWLFDGGKTLHLVRSEAGMKHITLSEKLALSAGRPTGFDYLRIILSASVVCWHSAVTSYGSDADIALWTSDLRPLIRLILPMFFALSGFLVAGSLVRTATLVQFLGLRAIRIYPALAVEVVLSALLLGPLVTRLPLTDYFTSPLFRDYLLNATGEIHYLLPGVFETNPNPNMVNGQIWTIPYELACYIALAGLAVIGVKKYHWIAPVLTGLLMVGYLAARLIKHHGELPFIPGAFPGFLLVVCFLSGVSLYLYKDSVPWSRSLCAVTGIASALCLGFLPISDYIIAPVAAYFTISLGLNNPKKLRVLQGADYSYGIFLYGYVIQQTIVFLFPWAREWWINILISLPLAAMVAAVSWHFVEKPALKLRRYIQPRSAASNPAVLSGSKILATE